MRKEFILVNIFSHEVVKDRKGQPIIRLGKKPYETPKGYTHQQGFQWESIEETVIDRNTHGQATVRDARFSESDLHEIHCTTGE